MAKKLSIPIMRVQIPRKFKCTKKYRIHAPNI